MGEFRNARRMLQVHLAIIALIAAILAARASIMARNPRLPRLLASSTPFAFTGELFYFHFAMMGGGGAWLALSLPYGYGLVIAMRIGQLSGGLSFIMSCSALSHWHLELAAGVAVFGVMLVGMSSALRMANAKMLAEGIRSRTAILGPAECGWRSNSHIALPDPSQLGRPCGEVDKLQMDRI